jgi:hypothetical protein
MFSTKRLIPENFLPALMAISTQVGNIRSRIDLPRFLSADKRLRAGVKSSGCSGPSDRSGEELPGAVRETIRNRDQQPRFDKSVAGPEAEGPATRIARPRNPGITASQLN